MRRLIILLLLAILPVVSTAQNEVSLNVNQAKVQINRNIYGHFAEHLGRLIYDGIFVGKNNTSIPNTDGVRNDIIKALKDLKIPNLRWPGGCFADTYHWMDAVGPQSERKPIENLIMGKCARR